MLCIVPFLHLRARSAPASRQAGGAGHTMAKKTLNPKQHARWLVELLGSFSF